MTALAPSLQAFFSERLITQRNSSPQTIGAYRDTFRLLLAFAQQQTGKQPFELDLDDLDAPLIGAFLNHLEQDRGNSPRTRNARLGAIHSFYRFAALEHPEHAATIARVMAIPTKRHERNTVSYLDLDEIKALLAAPDTGTWLGRRDHALLLVMVQTGVRVSELVGLHIDDVHLGTGPHCRVTGKGRKKRATPRPAHPRTRPMAGKRRVRALQLLRSAWQRRCGLSVPRSGGTALADGAPAPQPAHQPDMGAHSPPQSPMATTYPHPASMAEREVRRQDPRQEPSALDAHAGICAGGGRQRPSLPR